MRHQVKSQSKLAKHTLFWAVVFSAIPILFFSQVIRDKREAQSEIQALREDNGRLLEACRKAQLNYEFEAVYHNAERAMKGDPQREVIRSHCSE